MPQPIKKRRVVSKRKAVERKKAKNGARKGSTARAPRPSTTVTQPTPEEEAAFTEALIESGRAARLDKEGKLPAGATHKIVEDEAGNVKVVRRRFSIA